MSEEPLSGHEAHEVDRLTRGRVLTDAEIACYLADHQTSLRHATAHIGDEIAEQLRDRLAAPRSVETAGLDNLHGLPLEDVLRWVFAQYQVIPDEPKVVVLGWASDAAKIVAEKMRKAAAEHVGRSPAAPRPEGLDGRLFDLLDKSLTRYLMDLGVKDKATAQTVLRGVASSMAARLAAPRSVETAGLRTPVDPLRAALRTVEDAIDATPDSDEWRAFMLVERAALSSAAPRPEGALQRIYAAIRAAIVQPDASLDTAYVPWRAIKAAFMDAAAPPPETAGLREAARDILTSFARRPGWVLEHDSEEAAALRVALSPDATETRTLGGTSGTNPPPPPPQDRG